MGWARLRPETHPREDTGRDDGERLNRDLLLALQRGGRFYPTGTVIEGRFFLRACFLHPRTTHADTDALLEEVRSLGETLLRRA